MKSILVPVGQAAKRILRYYEHLVSHRETLFGDVVDVGYDAGIVVTNDDQHLRKIYGAADRC